MIAELNHRVRNILSLVRGAGGAEQGHREKRRGIRRRARRPHPGAGARARPDHQSELGAGGAAHRCSNPRPAPISARAPDRVKIGGPDVALDPKAFATLALVVHEMMTNSAKYGALADSTGRSRWSWRLDPDSSLDDRLEGERRPAGAAAVAPRLRHHHHRAVRSVRSQGRSRNPLRSARRAGAVRDPAELRRARAVNRRSRHARRGTAIHAVPAFPTRR